MHRTVTPRAPLGDGTREEVSTCKAHLLLHHAVGQMDMELTWIALLA